MAEWICRKCGQRHSAQQWLLNAEKKCHGCGSLTVTPDNDPTYTPEAPTAAASVTETLGPPLPDRTPPPEPDESDDEDDEDEKEDENGESEEEEIRKERVKLAEARRREIKAKPKPKKRK